MVEQVVIWHAFRKIRGGVGAMRNIDELAKVNRGSFNKNVLVAHPRWLEPDIGATGSPIALCMLDVTSRRRGNCWMARK